MIVNQKKINKPWGHEIIWSQCEKFVGKILYIKKEHKLSRQYHVKKEETILVLSGKLLLEIGKDKNIKNIILNEGESYHIIPGSVHRFSADFGNVKLAEVSTPEIDDVVRIEDEYNRK